MSHYWVQVLEKDGGNLKLRVSLGHPDISEFGADREFAWGLLVDGLPGQEPGRDRAQRSIRRTSVGPVVGGTETARDAKGITVDPASWNMDNPPYPSVIFEIQCTDAGIVEEIEPDTDYESWASLESGPPLLEGE